MVRKNRSSSYNSQKSKIRDKKNKPQDTSLFDATSRRGVLLISIFVIFIGLGNEILLIAGVLTLIIGLFLFLTDSWIIYLLTYLLWTFGAIGGFLTTYTHNIIGIIGLAFVFFIGVGYIGILIQRKRKNVKGYVDI